MIDPKMVKNVLMAKSYGENENIKISSPVNLPDVNKTYHQEHHFSGSERGEREL